MPRSKYGLTKGEKGWFKRVGGKLRWVASLKAAPTLAAAESIYEAKFADFVSAAPIRVSRSAVTLEALCAAYLESRRALYLANRLHRDTLRDDQHFLAKLAGMTGGGSRMTQIGPADFSQFAETLIGSAPSVRLKAVTVIRAALRFGVRNGLLAAMPDLGMLVRPRKDEFRRHRAKVGVRLYTASQFRRLLRHANDRWRAMILMAANTGVGMEELVGLGPEDIIRAHLSGLRQKTGVLRDAPLWPETLAALAALPKRPLLFADKKLASVNNLHSRFRTLCNRSCVPPMGFYTLKRTMRTLLDEHLDQRAAALVVGHETGDIGGVYVQKIHVDRLNKAVTYVREALRVSRAANSSRYGREQCLQARLADRRRRASG